MIPGPITPRMPVDPGAAQRPQTELTGEAAEAGASFADLLAAMLAPGAAGSQLQTAASAPPETVFERLDAAEIFNETGLFRGAAPLPSADQVAAAVEDAAAAPGTTAAAATTAAAEPARRGPAATPPPNPQAQLQASLSPAPAEPAPPPAAGPVPTAAEQAALDGTQGTGNAGGAAGGVSRAAARAMLTLRGQPVAVPAGPPQSAESPREAAGAGRASPRTAAMLVQAYLAKAGSMPAQVSVQAVEGGISLVARADKLTREERDRLRIEIGELLARHGFAVAEMTLNGEAWPLPQKRND